MPDIRNINQREVLALLELEEGHYADLKRAAIAPAKLSESVSAFANMSGGELYVGIGEIKDDAGKVTHREWMGFSDQEAANAHIKVIQEMTPLGTHCGFEYLKADYKSGYVLHIVVFKVREVVLATDRNAYVRKGPQNIRIKDEESLRRLRLDKGLQSFEDETLDVDSERLYGSEAVSKFMAHKVPGTDPLYWLKKQNLVVSAKPTVAGTLLFDDEPQAVIPKRSAIKIYRYKSKSAEGDRDTLAL